MNDKNVVPCEKCGGIKYTYSRYKDATIITCDNCHNSDAVQL